MLCRSENVPTHPLEFESMVVVPAPPRRKVGWYFGYRITPHGVGAAIVAVLAAPLQCGYSHSFVIAVARRKPFAARQALTNSASAKGECLQ